jgi:hypothetical protein
MKYWEGWCTDGRCTEYTTAGQFLITLNTQLPNDAIIPFPDICPRKK